MEPRRKGDLFYLVIGICLGITVGLALGRFWLFQPKPLVLEVPSPPPPPTPSPIRVYVSGAVARPGVYTLPADARVQDAVEAAGGLAADADQVAVNLASPLSDGDHVHVPARGEAAAPTQVSVAARAAHSAAKAEEEVRFPVDVNTASAQELEAIPGVGPATAARIIENRPYATVDDLLRVKGIGPATLEKIRPYVTVGEEK